MRAFNHPHHHHSQDELTAEGALMADQLLVAADKYQLERLRWLCEKSLISALTEENVVRWGRWGRWGREGMREGEIVQKYTD